MAKRRAKRIADRKVKEEISEEERPLLTLIASVIAQIAMREMDVTEEFETNNKLFNKKSSTVIKARKQKVSLSGTIGNNFNRMIINVLNDFSYKRLKKHSFNKVLIVRYL